MLFTRGPLWRLFVVLWCCMGAYTFTADGMLHCQHVAEDVIQAAAETGAIDAGEQTGTADIRIPHVSVAAVALRNPMRYAKQAARPVRRAGKPRRLSHFEYCSRDMVRSIMLQFHPREEYNNNFYGILCHFTAFYVILRHFMSFKEKYIVGFYTENKKGRSYRAP